MNLLRGTRTYLFGQMQYFDGAPWREKVQKELETLGVTVFNPYQKPFIDGTLEDDNARRELAEWMTKEEYDKVADRMIKVRLEDLCQCQISDYLFGYIHPSYPTVGAWEEFFYSNNMHKPIFLVIEGGLAKCPLWLFGVLPLKYIYGSIDEALTMLRAIDSGDKKIDNDRWRILKKEYICTGK